MADTRLINAARRFWTREEIETAYKAIFTAYYDRQSEKVEITGVTFEGESSTGQVVIERADFLEWMDALEALLQEKEAADSGESPGPDSSPIANYGLRYLIP